MSAYKAVNSRGVTFSFFVIARPCAWDSAPCIVHFVKYLPRNMLEFHSLWFAVKLKYCVRSEKQRLCASLSHIPYKHRPRFALQTGGTSFVLSVPQSPPWFPLRRCRLLVPLVVNTCISDQDWFITWHAFCSLQLSLSLDVLLQTVPRQEELFWVPWLRENLMLQLSSGEETLPSRKGSVKARNCDLSSKLM